MARDSADRPKRVASVVLIIVILLALAPTVPVFWHGAMSPRLFPVGDAFAQECVTTCESFDKLVESWSIVESRHEAVVAAASETGVPANLIKAIMKLESNGLNLLPNGASAVGPMQVTLNSWGWWAQTNGLNLYNAEQNIMAGAKILDRFRLQYIEWSRQHGIDPWLTALYAYYAGNPYNLLSRDSPAHGGMGITTQEYGARIWYSYQFLQDNWAALSQAKIQESTTMRANAGANPARATDGNINTTWAVTGHQDPPPGAYLQIDLGEPTRIFEIAWVFRTTGHADRLRIRVSDDGVNYETIHVAGNAPARQWQYLMIDRPARFVRFNVDNPNGDMTIGYLAEVTVRGVKASEFVAPPMPSVTLDLPASGGSKGATHTSRIRDGKLNTSWYTTGGAYPASGFVYVDLGYEAKITQVAWVFSKSGGAPLLEIQVSNDKRTWTTIGTAGDAAASEWQRLTTTATGRYVRWLVTNISGVRQIGYIAEVEIRQGGITEEVPPTPTPAPTDPEHELPGSGGSAGATWTGRVRDGRLNTDWRTSGSPSPANGYFYIDLGSELPIGALEWVFSQSGGAPHLELQVSNDKQVWTSVGTASDAPAGVWQRLDVAVTARYVRWLFVNSTGVDQIGYVAEVRILAASIDPTPTPTETATAEPSETVVAVDSSALPGATPIAIMSITDSGSGLPGAAIDGATASDWSAPAGPAWLMAELSALHAITHIAWLPVDGDCAAGLTIEVSEDGEHWGISIGYPTATPFVWQVANVDVEGRFVRWSVAGSGAPAGCLAEVAVYGYPAAGETPDAATVEPTPSETLTESTPTQEVTNEPQVALPAEPTEPAIIEPTATLYVEPTIEATEIPSTNPELETTVSPVEPTTTPESAPPADEASGA